jgi:hypothetical protein
MQTALLVFRNHPATPSFAACQQTQGHHEVYQITVRFYTPAQAAFISKHNPGNKLLLTNLFQIKLARVYILYFRTEASERTFRNT